MKTVNIHDAKTHLSRLLEHVANGEPFVIAKAGKPVAKVVPIDGVDTSGSSRIGFMDGQFSVPDDFDSMGEQEIATLFGLDR